MDHTITLSREQKKLVEEKVQAGGYTSEREVVGAGLRLLDEHDRRVKKLRDMVHKGLESGGALPAEDVYAELRAKNQEQRQKGT